MSEAAAEKGLQKFDLPEIIQMSECESVIRKNPQLALLSATATTEESSEVDMQKSVDEEFLFEKEIDCLPMHVKRKLDRIALKIRRAQWLGISPEERATIARTPALTNKECEVFKELVRNILDRYGEEPIVLAPNTAQSAQTPAEIPAIVIQSAREVGVVLEQADWAKLSSIQRYALTKLVDPSKKRKRARAIREFLSGNAIG